MLECRYDVGGHKGAAIHGNVVERVEGDGEGEIGRVQIDDIVGALRRHPIDHRLGQITVRVEQGNAATGLEFSAVTAVVLGGASLAGGRGSITGTILGVLVIGVVNNGIVLLNIESFWQDVTRGTLLIFAVAVDQLRLRLTRD